MHRGNITPNSFGNSPPFNNGNGVFKSPGYPPRMHCSPGGRYQQQYVPHYTGPQRGSPNNMYMKSPRRNDSSFSPQNNSFEYQSPNYNRSFRPNNSNSSTGPKSRSFNKGDHYNRNWTPDNKYCNNSPRFSMNFSSPRNDPYSNPGGSNDISVYYCPEMIQDPWANLKTNSVSKSDDQKHS